MEMLILLQNAGFSKIKEKYLVQQYSIGFVLRLLRYCFLIQRILLESSMQQFPGIVYARCYALMNLRSRKR